MAELKPLSAALDPRPILEEMTVLIPTLGRPILEESLVHIAAGTAWPRCLIIVDQGKNDDVAGWLATLAVLGIETRHIRAPRRGRAAGLNRGLEALTTRFVAVTDDDCFVDAHWLANLAGRLAEFPEAIVTGQVDQAGDEAVPLVVDAPDMAIYRRPRLKFDTMSGGNMGTSRTVLERVGLFDEDPRLATAEDGEWAYRALRAGIPIVYAPEIAVSHVGWRSEGERLAQYRSYARSHGGFYGKYLRRGDLFIAARAAVHLARSLRRWVMGRWRGEDELAMLGRAYFLGLPRGMVAGMRRGERP